MCEHTTDFSEIKDGIRKLDARVQKLDERVQTLEAVIHGMRNAGMNGMLSKQQSLRSDVNSLSGKLDKLIEERRLVIVAIIAFTITNIPELARFVNGLLAGLR